MNSDWTIQLPLWLSLGLTVLGVIISIMLARLAYGGVLFSFTVFLTIGILVFGIHHVLEIFGFGTELASVCFEVLASVIFLAAAVYLGYRVRKIIYG